MPRLLLPLALGAASATGFAPLGWWPIALAAFAGLIRLIGRDASPRHAAATGWAFGLGHFAVGLNWIATAFGFQQAMPPWLGWVAVGLLSIYLAVFPGLAALLAHRIGGRRTGPLALALAGSWIATEWLRATLFTGFAWNPLGVMLVDIGVAARFIGTFGLSAVVVLGAGALAALIDRAWKTSAVLAATPLATALLALAMPPALDAGPGATQLRVVQPNINQNEKWDPALSLRNYRRLAELSGTPSTAPRLLLWPEAAVPAYLGEDGESRQALAGLLGARDILLTGATDLVRDGGGEVVAAHNSLFAIDARGRIVGRYDKAHLVPYGEYLPMRALLSRIGLSRLAPGDVDFEPGPGPRTLGLPGHARMGVQICYEMIFPGAVVDAANRPDFIFNPSNDAWFGAWGPPQHLAQARLRAIEEGIPVVRSTPTGISALIDAGGKLRETIGFQRAGAFEAALPPALPPTPFARHGNLLSGLLALLLISIAIAARRRKR